MKISKYLLILLTLSMGCSKNFLDAPLQGQSTPANDPNVATNLVTGAYSSLIYTDAVARSADSIHMVLPLYLQPILCLMMQIKEALPVIRNLLQGRFDDFSYTSGNSFINSVWSGHYAAISRVNNSLNAIAVAPIDSATARRLRGEVLFIRAYYYFNLVRFFGGVPIVTEIPDGPQAANTNPAFVTRASAQDVYNTEIIPDLQYSIANCPLRGNTPSGRITKGAAQTLLAKVYMYLQNWQATKDLTDSVMTEGYALAPDYRTLWREVGDNNVESIFEIETGSYGEYRCRYSIIFRMSGSKSIFRRLEQSRI
ncbi:MAG: RagB/SusD family nutrient uptake outer membrane protein [Puia sp.]